MAGLRIPFPPRTISGKIMLGYLVLCILLAGIGFLAYTRMTEISASFTAYTNNLAAEMRLTQDISTQAMMVRLFANSYVDTHAQDGLNAFNTHITNLHEQVDAARQILLEPDQRRLAERLATLTDDYETCFRQVIALIQERQSIQYGALSAARFQVDTLLDSVRVAVSSGDSKAFLLLANAREALAGMHMHTSQYLQHGDERDAVLFGKARDRLLQAVEGLEKLVTDPRHGQNIALLKSTIQEFAAQMQRLRANSQREHRLIHNTLREHETDIAGLVDQIVLGIGDQVSTREQASTLFLERVRHEILGALGVIFAVALLMSLAISKGIAAALNKVMHASRRICDTDLRVLSESFKKLSTGDVRADFVVTAEVLRIQRSDEAGRMGAAFDDMIRRLKEAEQSFASMISYLRDKVQTAVTVAQGDLDQEVPLSSSNDALGAALADMLLHLRMSREQVRQHQDNLTDLVAVRTAELEENRRFLSTLLANLPGMAFRCKNDQAWSMEFVSQGCLDLTGYTPQDFMHESAVTYNAIIHPDHRMVVRRELEKALATGNAFQMEYPLITVSGQEKWVYEQCIGVHDDQGRFLALEGFIIDISERKRLEMERLDMERRLLHGQKLESLGVLAGGIAHDFNNLLAVILGNLELALSSIPTGAAERGRLEQTEKAARQAALLTRKMLDFSGKGHFEVSKMDLNRLLEENADIFRSSIARTMTLSVRLAPALPPILADAGQLQQVVMNLITNASESMEDRPGELTLATGFAHYSTEELQGARNDPAPQAGWYVWMEVTDQGVGMDKATRQRLFDPFFSTKFTGRGLGLAAVVGIIQGHKGAIMVDSRPGQGTTFRVLFPVSDKERAAFQHPAPDHPPAPVHRDEPPPSATIFSGRHILVVDDEEMVRATCVEALHHLGYATLEAEDGVRALEIFQKNQETIACVFLDLMMPRLDGLGTFNELRGLQPELPIILCSGFSTKEAASRFQNRKPSGFLQKPYSIAQLERELARALALADKDDTPE
jgi:PAS domain S-box-containing protein